MMSFPRFDEVDFDSVDGDVNVEWLERVIEHKQKAEEAMQFT